MNRKEREEKDAPQGFSEHGRIDPKSAARAQEFSEREIDRGAVDY
jgi:hypothetical protein